MNPWDFLEAAGALAVPTDAPLFPGLSAAEEPVVAARHLPRWRGFKSLEHGQFGPSPFSGPARRGF
jgi:hypothetical protein